MVESEQIVLDNRELKVMQLINRIMDLIREPSQTKFGSVNDLMEDSQPTVPAPAFTKIVQ